MTLCDRLCLCVCVPAGGGPSGQSGAVVTLCDRLCVCVFQPEEGPQVSLERW